MYQTLASNILNVILFNLFNNPSLSSSPQCLAISNISCILVINLCAISLFHNRSLFCSLLLPLLKEFSKYLWIKYGINVVIATLQRKGYI